MTLTLKVWRQKDAKSKGDFETYTAKNISKDMSFLEMLDEVNEDLVGNGNKPAIAFDHDCREGICGMCSLVINGRAHGPDTGTTTCQLHMRRFNDGDTIWIEPWRAQAFPIVRDLIVDRSSMDRIIQAGGYVGVNTGGTPDANAIPIPKVDADAAMDAAACIGCGACVAACPNAAAMLFTGAKMSQLHHLPQGQVERTERAFNMITQMDSEGFGNCTNLFECEGACPKEISVNVIAEMNRDYAKAALLKK
ncbi:MAG: succinate dehydrogenase/fumarate reductase iron-sulfur subunit [Deltaproteobacteria bacterium]|nr:succinate dehydrogenase/fumarate reductase iron-sulfur subunit [Deltaproteobacteria bacterium]